MFGKATKKLVEQTDSKGSLIAASGLNDSKKLQPLAVVQKIPKNWVWQPTKYKPTEFKLDDLLEGDPIKPVCEEEEFVKFEGDYRISSTGSVEMGVHALRLLAKGEGTSKFCLSLGTLKKEAVNIPKLVKLIRGRKLDLTSSFFKKKNKTRLTLVKERIFTTHDCSISYTGLKKASCSAEIGYAEMGLSTKDSGTLQCDCQTAFKIPPDTVMAYSVVEMTIESDGYFDLCVGFSGVESDDFSENPFPTWSEVEQIEKGSPLTTLKKALADVQTSFCALADLSAESRSSILLLLRRIMTDRSVLSALVDQLEVLNGGEAPCFLTSELSEEQRQNIGAFLDLLKCDQLDKTSSTNHSGPSLASSTPEERNGCHTAVSHENGCSTKASEQSKELMYAMQMLMNALEALTDNGLDLLEPFCTSEGLQSLHDLVTHLTTSDMWLCKDTIPVFLQHDNDFHRVEELFKSCSVLIRKENDTLTSEITCTQGFLPMVLCIAIHGLASFVAV